jgi:hypothetical protein
VRRLLGLTTKRSSTFSLLAFVAAGGASAAMNAARERARVQPPAPTAQGLEPPPVQVDLEELSAAPPEEARSAASARPRIRARSHMLAAIVIVLLTCVPVALNALRDDDFAVAMEAFLAGQRSPQASVAYVHELLGDPVVAQNAAATSGLTLETSRLQQRTELRPTLRSVLITVRGDTPEEAQATARGLRLALNGASDKRLAFGPEPAVPEPSRRMDRWIERLPGPFPPRRDPLWIALSGLAAGCVLCAAWYAYALRPSRG